jgi:hypothetical protein
MVSLQGWWTAESGCARRGEVEKALEVDKASREVQEK